MALEESLMKHRMQSEKIQIVTNTLASGSIKNETHYTTVEDILVKMIIENCNNGE